ncbi:unnamed protein product [Polarella glacialis]|uniref:Uncharacterized protein n=1 Tax=Polarella glacialis TaxID=89957 RepID=A0A813D7Q8_POLGL|nr:unnamed protein product [Polarella glacialis]
MSWRLRQTLRLEEASSERPGVSQEQLEAAEAAASSAMSFASRLGERLEEQRCRNLLAAARLHALRSIQEEEMLLVAAGTSQPSRGRPAQGRAPPRTFGAAGKSRKGQEHHLLPAGQQQRWQQQQRLQQQHQQQHSFGPRRGIRARHVLAITAPEKADRPALDIHPVRSAAGTWWLGDYEDELVPAMVSLADQGDAAESADEPIGLDADSSVSYRDAAGDANVTAGGDGSSSGASTRPSSLASATLDQRSRDVEGEEWLASPSKRLVARLSASPLAFELKQVRRATAVQKATTTADDMSEKLIKHIGTQPETSSLTSVMKLKSFLSKIGGISEAGGGKFDVRMSSQARQVPPPAAPLSSGYEGALEADEQ